MWGDTQSMIIGCREQSGLIDESCTFQPARCQPWLVVLVGGRAGTPVILLLLPAGGSPKAASS